MAETNRLLNLIQEFPAAFHDPEQMTAQPISQAPAAQISEKTKQLLQLVNEFPQAFADPEAALPGQVPLTAEAEASSTTVEADSSPVAGDAPIPSLPPGYTQALSRRISTFTWGTIDCYLTYGDKGLERIWITVGKSGTEVQSLCEAIARLANLLLSHAVPMVEIVKQLRGIRGGDSEGLGPHKILGLADLIGKVLQEAPVTVLQTAKLSAPTPVASETAELTTKATVQAAGPEPIPATQALFNFGDTDYTADLCPECGAQLQQVNGCSGGACTVCGYSSCS